MPRTIRTTLLTVIFIALLWSYQVSAQQIIVPPYIQPGNAPYLTKEQKIVIWQTDSVAGNYKVEFAVGTLGGKASVAKTSWVKLNLNNKTTFLYRASLTGLKFDSQYS